MVFTSAPLGCPVLNPNPILGLRGEREGARERARQNEREEQEGVQVGTISCQCVDPNHPQDKDFENVICCMLQCFAVNIWQCVNPNPILRVIQIHALTHVDCNTLHHTAEDILN